MTKTCRNKYELHNDLCTVNKVSFIYNKIQLKIGYVIYLPLKSHVYVMPGVGVIFVKKHKVLADKMCQQFNIIMSICEGIKYKQKDTCKTILEPNPEV